MKERKSVGMMTFPTEWKHKNCSNIYINRYKAYERANPSRAEIILRAHPINIATASAAVGRMDKSCMDHCPIATIDYPKFSTNHSASTNESTCMKCVQFLDLIF
jgi:hypothetical protein